jgi:adenine phosphoribosyltransferase
MAQLLAEALIRDILDFPKPGIVFKDITPILSDPVAFKQVIYSLVELTQERMPDVIAGIESRGFIFGVPIALCLELGFVPIRKEGKLPHKTIREEYALEYGTNVVEIHVDAIKPGQRVLIVDDLLATGGTAFAATKLIERAKGVVSGIICVVELEFLSGRKLLEGYRVDSLIRIS